MAKPAAKPVDDFSIISHFPFGYRNREDVTNLPPGVLIPGSQNVLTDVTGRVGIRQGYALDGQSSDVIAPILSAFDWETHVGVTRHLRAGFMTDGTDGKLQYRYVAEDGTVTWRDLLSSLTSVTFNFTDYWNATNSQAYLLFVNGTAKVYEWSGGITTVDSVTTNTITKEGVETWAEIGFYVTGTHKVTINGVDYTATGGWGTTTLTGVTPDPTGVVNTGDIAHQTPESTAASAITSLPTSFPLDGIANLRNQIYYGALENNIVYVSVVNNYKSVAFTSPVRVVGEGALVTMDGPWRAFIPQESEMYMSAGEDQWYQTKFQLSSDLAKESFEIVRLKTSAQQGAQSQAMTWKDPNNVTFISNEPVMNFLGRVDQVLQTPQLTNLSYSIVNDFNSYDFTDASGIYFKKFHYVAVPREGLIRVYNMTDESSEPARYWEAPLTIPISRFSIVDGELYGHSYLTSESYKLFTGYNDNGGPIDAKAYFSYQNFGTPDDSKSFNEFYVEGYISSNTTLVSQNVFEYNGFGGTQARDILGTDTQIVQINPNGNSLGKNPLGKEPLGGQAEASTSLPKFRVIITNPKTPFYEYSPRFKSLGTDFNWSIIRFGPQVTRTSEQNNAIKQ